MGKTNPVFSAKDWLIAAIATLISFIVYWFTTAPNVTLLDSGEFIVAAQHFGVPHPTGYPLWTILAWLFQLLPLGNAAWEINLFSGVCGSLACGLVALLGRSSLDWMLATSAHRAKSFILDASSIGFSLAFAFSFSMWSQATIAEVYTLHALTVGIYLLTLYLWLRKPESMWLLLGAFFWLAFGFSNHHLVVALAPLPFLAVLLAARHLFWDLVAAASLTVLLFYLGFAILSENWLVLKTGIRFFYCVALGFACFCWIRKMRIEWRLVAFLPLAVGLGLLPYLYMPLASSTNPPMNWGYTRTAEGFFYSINRSQYSGSLADQSLRVLGRAMGVVPAAEKAQPEPNALGIMPKTKLQVLQDWTGFFWLQLGRSFSPLGIIFYFAAFLAIFRLDLNRRVWIYLLHIAFVLAAFLQPVADGANIDLGGWWLQMPYHSYTNLIFALLCITGAAYVLDRLADRRRNLAVAASLLVLAVPLLPLWVNADECSQRDRWFGWSYGRDMLKNLPEGSVVYGGTDPGRFVPTYMILGESGQPPSLKRDPDFDRRDLYIITQNALADKFYIQYINDHYSDKRPKVQNWLERALGREHAYPEKPLILPTVPEMEQIVAKGFSEEKELTAGEELGLDPTAQAHGVVAKWIFDKNKDQHSFFVEESFAMPWTYSHAIPYGLVYKINPDPLEELPEAVVKADFEFWDAYSELLLTNPRYTRDFDAQRSFSKLRQSIANIYTYRKMFKEAEAAYRQALNLWPSNLEALMRLNTILWDQERFDEILAIFESAILQDFNNENLLHLYTIVKRRKEFHYQIVAQREAVDKNPDDSEAVMALLKLYAQVGEPDKGLNLLETGIEKFATNAAFQEFAITYLRQQGLLKKALPAGKNLLQLKPQDGETHYLMAQIQLALGNEDACYEQMQLAIQYGGILMRQQFSSDPDFRSLLSIERFKKLMGSEIQ